MAACLKSRFSFLKHFRISYQTRFNSIKGFAKTDTVNIYTKNSVCDLDLKIINWDGDGTAYIFRQGSVVTPQMNNS